MLERRRSRRCSSSGRTGSFPGRERSGSRTTASGVLARTRACEAGVLLNYEHLLFEQKVKVKSDSSYCFQFNEMARPAGLEPAPFCLEGRRSRFTD